MTNHSCAVGDAPLDQPSFQEADMFRDMRQEGPMTIGVSRYDTILSKLAVYQDEPGAEGGLALSRATRGRLAAVLLAVTLPFWSACADSPTAPSASALVTFRVGNETFRVQLVEDEDIEAARKAQQGGSARIPIGRIVSGTSVNSGWSWHLVDVQFAEATIELCDGLPSHVEQAGGAFANGYYCPWSAQITAIREVPSRQVRVVDAPRPDRQWSASTCAYFTQALAHALRIAGINL